MDINEFANKIGDFMAQEVKNTREFEAWFWEDLPRFLLADKNKEIVDFIHKSPFDIDSLKQILLGYYKDRKNYTEETMKDAIVSHFINYDTFVPDAANDEENMPKNVEVMSEDDDLDKAA